MAMTNTLSIARLFSTTKPVRYSTPACGPSCSRPAAEADAQGDVERREQQALAHTDLAAAPVQDAEVEDQQDQDDAEKEQPEPSGLAEQVGHQQVDGHPSSPPGAIAPVGAVADGRSDIAVDDSTARGARTSAREMWRTVRVSRATRAFVSL
jgi:hypothetical protein